MQELKNFYEKNKNRISITDEYGEEQDIDELFKTIDNRYKNKNSLDKKYKKAKEKK